MHIQNYLTKKKKQAAYIAAFHQISSNFRNECRWKWSCCKPSLGGVWRDVSLRADLDALPVEKKRVYRLQGKNKGVMHHVDMIAPHSLSYGN